jgi:hypothetical protein
MFVQVSVFETAQCGHMFPHDRPPACDRHTALRAIPIALRRLHIDPKIQRTVLRQSIAVYVEVIQPTGQQLLLLDQRRWMLTLRFARQQLGL